jgi:hypothetical protein
VVTELDLAATFSNIAPNTRKDAWFLHNFKLTRLALSTATRFLTGCNVTFEMNQAISFRIHILSPKLKELGLRASERLVRQRENLAGQPEQGEL